MLDTILAIIPLALAAAINPLGILVVIFLLSRNDRPLVRAWLFLAGSTAVLIVFALVAQPLLGHTLGRSSHESSVSAIINLVLGVGLILWTLLAKKKSKPRIKEDASLWKIFVVGVIFMLVLDLETIIFYFAALKTIFDAKLSWGQDIIIFIINIIIVMSTMAFPALLATLIPRKSAKILAWLNNFITKHGPLFSKIVVVVIALYLIYKGLVFFF